MKADRPSMPDANNEGGESTPVDVNIDANRGRWSFADGTAEHFVPHITKSVPFYKEGHRLIEKMGRSFVRSDSTICEIGCSTGELIGELSG